MGWGVYLMVGRDGKEVRRCARQEALADHSVRHLSTKTMLDGRTLAVLGADCSMQLICSRCGAVSCIGCGMRVVLDLDAKEDDDAQLCPACAHDPTGELFEDPLINT